MIAKDSLQPEWIQKVSAENRKADKILIEKVIRALLLLEGLVESGLPFIFKGGTAVMLLQRQPKRFSIDLDIIVPGKADFDALFATFIEAKGFTRFEEQRRGASSQHRKASLQILLQARASNESLRRQYPARYSVGRLTIPNHCTDGY